MDDTKTYNFSTSVQSRCHRIDTQLYTGLNYDKQFNDTSRNALGDVFCIVMLSVVIQNAGFEPLISG